MKLFYHLYGYLLLGMIALIGVDEFISYQAEVAQYEADMITNAIQDGTSVSGMIAHTWQESGEEKARKLLRDASRSGSLNIRWVWPHRLHEELAAQPAAQEQLKMVFAGAPVSFKMTGNKGEPLRFTYVPVDIGGPVLGALELSQSLSLFEAFSRKMVIRAVSITVLLALVCGLTLYIFMDRKIRIPLKRLTDHAKQIGRGNLSADTSVVGNDELAEMGHTMNDMCSRLIIAKEKIKFEYEARLKTLEQLRHTERLSSFGVLSAEIAHELGTPLNVVDGRAKMITHENLTEEEIEECATIIRNQAERMATIIRQLLDFTRRPEKKVSSENIAFLIKQVFQLLYPMASKHKVSFVLDMAENTEMVLSADFSQLQQVLVNLLMNSIQAMPEGGKVEVKLSNERIRPPFGKDDDCHSYLKLLIQDEGEGICQENLDQIFTPFFTTKTLGTGTGLGLSIAHGIVEEHGGWIDVESGSRGGACFTVYLPMKEQSQ